MVLIYTHPLAHEPTSLYKYIANAIADAIETSIMFASINATSMACVHARIGRHLEYYVCCRVEIVGLDNMTDIHTKCNPSQQKSSQEQQSEI